MMLKVTFCATDVRVQTVIGFLNPSNCSRIQVDVSEGECVRVQQSDVKQNNCANNANKVVI